jgi:arylformamidase
MSVHPLDAVGSVPDIGAYNARFLRESALARAEFAMEADLAYGDSAAETLDFFPAGAGAPLAIFFHGGYWARRDKHEFSYIARGLVPHGIAIANVNYGLAPATPLREIVAQARRAVRWCRANHARFGTDPARMSVFGHSAGGHLAAMCAIDTPVHAVASISGLHDLEPVRASFANDWLQLDPAQAAALSPISHAPRPGCRLYATAGSNESDAFKAQSQAIVDAWSDRGVPAAYEESPGDDHFSICFRLLDPDDYLTRTIVESFVSRRTPHAPVRG